MQDDADSVKFAAARRGRDGIETLDHAHFSSHFCPTHPHLLFPTTHSIQPTNHLDITSKEVLEDALQHFDGSVMIVSHDRYFMSQVVNTIFAFKDRRMQRHDCDYHDYMEQEGNLKEKVTSRYVEGDSYRITNAKEVVVEEAPKSKKNFGGSGVTSGNLYKVSCYCEAE